MVHTKCTSQGGWALAPLPALCPLHILMDVQAERKEEREVTQLAKRSAWRPVPSDSPSAAQPLPGAGLLGTVDLLKATVLLLEEGCQNMSPIENRGKLVGTEPREPRTWDLLWGHLVSAKSLLCF